MLDWLKHKLAHRELAALKRYRLACHEVFRWHARIASSYSTALWISEVGEGTRGLDSWDFREKLVKQGNLCPKCFAPMKPGTALVTLPTGSSDLGGDVCTMSLDPTKPKLIRCMKCPTCGFSHS